MNRIVLVLAVLFVAAATTAEAQVYVVRRPVVAVPVPVTTFYAPAPVTTFYAPPVVVPQTSYYAPAPMVYRAPVVVPPRYVYPGQPVRNVFRRPVVAW